MSDPAIQAANRAWNWEGPEAWHCAVKAAREALAPLRAKHQKVPSVGGYRCTSCRDAYGVHAEWPTGTDRLIYPEDEL